MAPIKIIQTNWQTHSAELSTIRIQVFMEEQQISAEDEWDGLDESATHFLIFDHNNAIGCARLLTEEHKESPCFHIGRVAVLKPWRGKGLGIALMRFIIRYCRKLAPDHRIYLHAQCERQGFYETLGFIAEGDMFMDAGIPHISMSYHNDQES